jgi:hypothetical protein
MRKIKGFLYIAKQLSIFFLPPLSSGKEKNKPLSDTSAFSACPVCPVKYRFAMLLQLITQAKGATP